MLLHPSIAWIKFQNECREMWKEASLELYRWVRRDWKKTLKYLFQRRFWIWWFLLAVITALGVVLSSYHNQIIGAMRPYKTSIGESHWAWLIPTILLIIVSFPPLIGHEIIILIVGMIWSLGVGFAIACVGTFLGELATYVAFKYLFRAKAKKLEEKNMLYACTARMMREGGLGILVLVRFSAMPGHIVTAIQSTIGVGVYKYGLACILTLPKQFSIVYLGYVYGQTGQEVDPTKKPNQQTGESLPVYYHNQKSYVSLIVFAITTLATIVAAYIVYIRARRLRPSVEAEMEQRRKAELQEMGEATPTGRRSLVLSRPGDAPTTASTPSAMMDRTSSAVDSINTPPQRFGTKPYTSFAADSSSASLLGSQWSINDTIGGRSRSSTINTRSRSGTLHSHHVRTPSLPDISAMQSYFEAVPAEEEELAALKSRRSSMLV